MCVVGVAKNGFGIYHPFTKQRKWTENVSKFQVETFNRATYTKVCYLITPVKDRVRWIAVTPAAFYPSDFPVWPGCCCCLLSPFDYNDNVFVAGVRRVGSLCRLTIRACRSV